MKHYIPFGINCFPALVLREAGLRSKSLPFDWVLANPEHIKRSLDLKFSDWFDQDVTTFKDNPKSYEVLKEKHSNGTGTIHPNYPIDAVIHPEGSFFPHVDLTNKETVNTLKGRIKNFYSIIDSEDEVVFVSSVPHEKLEEYGLINYFDRVGKTTFIFLEIVSAGWVAAEQKLDGQYPTICLYTNDLWTDESTITMAVKLKEFLKGEQNDSLDS